MKRKLLGLLFTFILVVSSMVPAASAYDAQIILHKAYYSSTTVRQTNIASSVFKWAQTSDGSLVPVYCLNPGKEAPSDNAMLYVGNDITSGPLLYVMQHGYQVDGSYDTAVMGANLDPETAYYATALAVWLVGGFYTPGQLDAKIPAVVAAINLYNVAKDVPLDTIGPVWSSMAIESYELHLSADGTRYDINLTCVVGAPQD